MCVKKTVVLIVAFMFLSFVQLVAQTSIQGLVQYESKTTVDLSRFNNSDIPEAFKTRMLERMRKMGERSYTLTFNQTESFYTEQEQENNGGRRWGPSMMSEIEKGPQYRNVKEGIMLQEQVVIGKKFLITDSLPKLDWKMGSETKQIGEYMCFKATATKTVPNLERRRFGPPPSEQNSQDRKANENEDKPLTKDIEVVAWYTLQIPINQGPAEYWGLPGLILEIVADNTTITCTKIEINPAIQEKIVRPSKGKKVSQKEYNAILRKKIQQIRAQNGRSDVRIGKPMPR